MEQTLVCCAGFKFYSDFDSANLARVAHIPQETPQQEIISNCKLDLPSSFEFNVWTRPDCAGTQFENGNRTWFYFGVKAAIPGIFVRLNIIDINKQAKMFSQGMVPVFKISPGKPIWERIRDRLTYTTSSDNIFSVSFKYKTPDNPEAIIYFAFTYPYSYTDLQNSLQSIDDNYLLAPILSKDDIYYVRECICKSIEGRRIELLTISSYHSITGAREDRLQNLFPERNIQRPFKFANKKVIFVSARVHPGETPSTFVLNGLLNLLLSRDDALALVLRRHYVFKLIPFLNPDGVSRGHYRTDTNGTNLNRVYLQPDLHQHPSIYAARALLRYYHFGGRVLPDPLTCSSSPTEQTHGHHSANNNSQQLSNTTDDPLVAHSHSESLNVNASNAEVVVERDVSTFIENSIVTTDRRLSNMSLTELSTQSDPPTIPGASSKESQLTFYRRILDATEEEEGVGHHKVVATSTRAGADDGAATLQRLTAIAVSNDLRGGDGSGDSNDTINDGNDGAAAEIDSDSDSGLFLYIDMHGHASKKGIFMYGNHFDNMADSVECMLLPKIMSLNNHNFHFSACNFTERNMYLKDRRDGMSREGSGRVAVLKLTGLVRSYTLECNYNTGRLTNTLSPTVRDNSATASVSAAASSYAVPPKYNPHVYEEVGRALGASILDLTGHNPLTRLPNSEFRSLTGLRQWLMTNCPAATTHRFIHHHHHHQPQRTHLMMMPHNDSKGASLTAPPLAAPDDAVDGAAVAVPGALSALKQSVCCGKSAATSARCNRYHHQHQQQHHRHRRTQHQQQQQQQRHLGNNGPKVRNCGVATGLATAAVAPSASTMAQHRRRVTAAAAAVAATVKQQQQQQMSSAATLVSVPANSRRLKLREICWIKGDTDIGQGKALIAKYTTIAAAAAAVVTATSSGSAGATSPVGQLAAGRSSSSIEENLIVSWDSNNSNPQVYAQKTNIVGHQRSNSTSVGINRSGNVAGGRTTMAVTARSGGNSSSNNKRPTFRVHNFRRRMHHHVFTHPVLTMTSTTATVTTPATTPATTAAAAARQRQRQRQLLLRQQHRCQRQSNGRGQDKQHKRFKSLTTTAPSNTAATVAAAASTSGATTEPQQQQQNHPSQLQSQRLQRSKRKRKRNKSGLVMTVHH